MGRVGSPHGHSPLILYPEFSLENPGPHTPGCPMKGNLVEKLHAATKDVEGKAGSKGINRHSSIHPFLQIYGHNRHAKSQILLPGRPSFSDMKIASAGRVHDKFMGIIPRRKHDIPKNLPSGY